VLSFEVKPDGGVLIEGNETDLLALATWLHLAVSRGHVAPSYVADRGMVTVEIRRFPEE